MYIYINKNPNCIVIGIFQKKEIQTIGLVLYKPLKEAVLVWVNTGSRAAHKGHTIMP